jgi:vacuolar-type H+-ATPase subunit I/STV1
VGREIVPAFARESGKGKEIQIMRSKIDELARERERLNGSLAAVLEAERNDTKSA